MQHAVESARGAAPPAGATQTPAGPLGLDRFTLAIAIGVAILIPVVFLVVLAQPKQTQPLDESRPAGVAHNYYLALTQDDLPKAYAYLSAEAKANITYEQFTARVTSVPERRGIRIDNERIEDGTARVTVRTTYGAPGPPLLSSEFTMERTVVLRMEDGTWKIAPPQPTTGPYGPTEPYDPYAW